MRNVNEALAKLFQKQAERDKDGVFHYLLKGENETLVVDTTPHSQWTNELMEKTLFIDIIDEQSHLIDDVTGENEASVCWISNGIMRGAIGAFPVDTLLFWEDEDNRELVIVGLDLVVTIDLSPDNLHFWVGLRNQFYTHIYDEQAYRELSAGSPGV